VTSPALLSIIESTLGAGVIQKKINKIEFNIILKGVTVFLGIGIVTMLTASSYFFFLTYMSRTLAALSVAGELLVANLLIFTGFKLFQKN